jgi:hypothetical protein
MVIFGEPKALTDLTLECMANDNVSSESADEPLGRPTTDLRHDKSKSGVISLTLDKEDRWILLKMFWKSISTMNILAV